jgi:hypothetical protein
MAGNLRDVAENLDVADNLDVAGNLDDMLKTS